MSYNVSWLIENIVILIDIDGEITFEKLCSISDDTIALLDESELSPVHVVVDLSKLGKHLTNIKNIVDAVQFLRHPTHGWFIIYGSGNKIVNFLSLMVAQTTKINYRRFLTQEEALEFLEAIDVRLQVSSDN